MMQETPHIAFMGDLTVDRYVTQESGLAHLGGSSMTGAIWATRLGARASVVAAVGSDPAGEEYIQVLEKGHIDHTHVAVMEGKTSAIDIVITSTGDREFGNWDPGVLEIYRFGKKDIAYMRTQDAVSLVVYDRTIGLLRQFSEEFSNQKSDHPVRVVDFGDLSQFQKSPQFVEGFLPSIDIAVFGLDKDIDGALIDNLREQSVHSNKLFVITLNRFGVVAFRGNDQWKYVGEEVPVVDATGAGDSFLAAFLVSFLRSGDIQESLKKGSDLAAQVIQKVGAY